MTEDAGWEERDRLKERRKSETIGLERERENEREGEREGTGGEGKEKTKREKYRKPSGAGTPASRDL